MIIETFHNFITSVPGMIITTGLSVFMALIAIHLFINKHVANKIKHAEAREGVYTICDFVVAFVLSLAEIFLISDTLDATFSWIVISASAGVGILLYLLLEKIFGESRLKQLGESVAAIISKSSQFEGKLTKKNMGKMSAEFLAKIADIDNAKKEAEDKKQEKAVNTLIAKINEVTADGVVTEVEKAEVDALVKDNADFKNSDFYKTYSAKLQG